MSSSSPRFDLRRIHKDDSDQVVSLLMNSFFRDEPIMRCLQVTNTFQFAKETVDCCVQQQHSFVAYDRETSRVVAICLSEIERRDLLGEINEPNEKLRFLFELCDQLHKKQRIFDRMNADVLLHIFIISVDRVARGHGLAAQLIAKSVAHAKELQLSGAFAEATNVYSLKCFERNHFQIVNELIYVEYSPERLATMTDPKYDRCSLVTLKF